MGSPAARAPTKAHARSAPARASRPFPAAPPQESLRRVRRELQDLLGMLSAKR